MMLLTVCLLVLIVATTWASYYDDYDYCKLPCNYGLKDERHLVCERDNYCGADLKKCLDFEAVEMTDKLKLFILDEHNKYRNKVAKGHERRGPTGAQPPASNMNALKYNDELGFVAQCWANTCQPSTHSRCHRSKKLPYAGQNLASRYNTAKAIDGKVETSIKRMISSWYEEVKIFDRNDISPYHFTKGSGHYTLMVWGEIQEIGCALAKFRNGIWYTISLVCHYGSTEVAGNIISKDMYKVGKPCTACPAGTKCNPRYSGLCGQDTLDLTGKLLNASAPHKKNYFPLEYDYEEYFIPLYFHGK